MSKVRVEMRVSVRTRVSLVLVMGCRWDRTSQSGVSGVTCRVPDV